MTDRYTAPSILSVALGARCPNCGRGKLFKGYLTVVDKCAVCGTDLSEHDSADGPAVFITFIMGFLAVGLAIWVEFTFHPSYWVHLAIWPPVILGGSILLLRPLKAAFVALQYRHRRHAMHGED
jgi:uncharacterized protein (DUF983 family)